MPKEFSRLDRIGDLIQKELALIIQRELRDEISFTTISHVKVSKDLAHAKVYVSVIMEDQAEQTLAKLNKSASFLRGLLAKRVKIRVMPVLNFVYDDSNIKANKLSKLIDEAVKSDRRSEEDDAD